MSITIVDSDGKRVSRINGTENKGINRVYWSFREDPPQTDQRRQATPAGRGRAGGFRMRGFLTALPGEYTVKISYEGEEASQPLTVKSDPRLDVDLDVLKANYEAAKAAQTLSQTMTSAGNLIQDNQKAIQTIMEYARAIFLRLILSFTLHIAPLQGLCCFLSVSQGVALSFYILPLRGVVIKELIRLLKYLHLGVNEIYRYRL